MFNPLWSQISVFSLAAVSNFRKKILNFLKRKNKSYWLVFKLCFRVFHAETNDFPTSACEISTFVTFGNSLVHINIVPEDSVDKNFHDTLSVSRAHSFMQRIITYFCDTITAKTFTYRQRWMNVTVCSWYACSWYSGYAITARTNLFKYVSKITLQKLTPMLSISQWARTAQSLWPQNG